MPTCMHRLHPATVADRSDVDSRLSVCGSLFDRHSRLCVSAAGSVSRVMLMRNGGRGPVAHLEPLDKDLQNSFNILLHNTLESRPISKNSSNS